MQKILFFCLVITLSACSSSQSIVKIPAQQTIELDYPQFEMYKASLNNKSLKELDVAVLSKETNQQIRGFGLGMKGKADVMVEQNSKLLLRNPNQSDVSLKLSITAESPKVLEKKGEYISFTLRNNTPKSIPLIIPSVMNPNLSPFSNSGVDLQIGQEILFRENGKKYTLLRVDEKIQTGEKLDVAMLIKQRKTELGLK